MKVRSKKAQSILEYTLLLGVIIGVIVWLLLGSGGMKGKVQDLYNKTGTAVQNTTNRMNQGVFN